MKILLMALSMTMLLCSCRAGKESSQADLSVSQVSSDSVAEKMVWSFGECDEKMKMFSVESDSNSYVIGFKAGGGEIEINPDGKVRLVGVAVSMGETASIKIDSSEEVFSSDSAHLEVDIDHHTNKDVVSSEQKSVVTNRPSSHYLLILFGVAVVFMTIMAKFYRSKN